MRLTTSSLGHLSSLAVSLDLPTFNGSRLTSIRAWRATLTRPLSARITKLQPAQPNSKPTPASLDSSLGAIFIPYMTTISRPCDLPSLPPFKAVTYGVSPEGFACPRPPFRFITLVADIPMLVDQRLELPAS